MDNYKTLINKITTTGNPKTFDTNNVSAPLLGF